MTDNVIFDINGADIVIGAESHDYGATVSITVATLAATVLAALVALAPAAHADDDDDQAPNTTQEICGAYNYGQPPADIPGNLGRNDARENYWRAQHQTEQTIIGGQCG